MIGRPRDNKPSFIQVLRLMVHPSQKGRELPRPTQSTLTPPKTTGTDLGHRASVQRTTGRRRVFVTGRSILVSISKAITTSVLTRGARPGTPLLVAPTPGLVSATAGATLGAPRGIPIPRLVGSRACSRRPPGPTHGRAKYQPAPPAGGDSLVAAGGCSGGARAGRTRLNGTTPEGTPPEHRGPPPAPRPRQGCSGDPRHPRRPTGHLRVVARRRLGNRLGRPGTVPAEKGAK